jgi:hypothetical protein
MRSVNRIIIIAALATMIGGDLFAQDDAARALIGKWEGTVTGAAGTAPTRLEFSEKHGKLLWAWSWEASIGKGEAEGSVTKYTPPSIELNGRYTLHPNRMVRNSPVTMSLTVAGDQMQGTGITAAVNQTFTLSVGKK